MSDKSVYVWYKGRCWRQDSSDITTGRTLLVDLKDSSRGMTAKLSEIRTCDQKTVEAIEWFLKRHNQQRGD